MRRHRFLQVMPLLVLLLGWWLATRGAMLFEVPVSLHRWFEWVGLSLVWLAGAALFNQLLHGLLWNRALPQALGVPVPGALKAMTTVLIYMVTATCIVGIVFGHSVTAFLATLGAGGVVLGFALRSLFADIFTGLAINLDRSFMIGDWVQINEGVSGNIVGRINEIGWRCTSLTTEEQTNVVVPNGMLGLERMINITRPQEPTRYETTVTVEYSVSPVRVKRVLLAALHALDQVPGFMTEKPPVVLVSKTDELGVDYLLRYWIHPWNPISPTSAEDAVLSSALQYLHTAGIALAYPKRDVFTATMPTRQFDGHEAADLAALLAQTDLFEALDGEDLGEIAEHMQRRHVARGHDLVRQGDKGKSLYLLIEGLLDVYVEVDGHDERVGRIHPGECFGEMSLLTGERRSATVRATCESIVYEVGKKPITELMQRRPELVESLSRTLAERQVGTAAALGERESEERAAEVEGFTRQLLGRMREFLELRLT